MRDEILGYLEERFGIPASMFEGFGFYGASRGRIYLGPKSVLPRPEPVSVGILVARAGGALKPTTNLIQLFGRHATRNVVSLGRENALRYANGDDLTLAPGEKEDTTDGYVILSYLGSPMGCGRLAGDVVSNLLPKGKRLKLKFL
jgi:NOL1/NOP2/fmu family ribosome biogenesis protein